MMSAGLKVAIYIISARFPLQLRAKTVADEVIKDTQDKGAQ